MQGIEMTSLRVAGLGVLGFRVGALAHGWILQHPIPKKGTTPKPCGMFPSILTVLKRDYSTPDYHPH